MTRLTLEEIFIKNIKQELPEASMAYMTKEAAYAARKKWTGQDFGYDAEKWKKWIDENGIPLLNITPNKLEE
jgi:hypothetical protein